MEARKQYTKEFKLDAISLVVDQGLTIAEVARSLEIRANMLGRWIKENEADNNGQAFRGNGKLTPDQEEIRRLKIENKQLKLERQILKEAAVFLVRKKRSEVFVHHPKEEDLPGRPTRMICHKQLLDAWDIARSDYIYRSR
jgi:transposase